MKKPSTLVLVYLAIALGSAHAAEVSVALAANFSAPMQKIAAAFLQDTGHKAVLSYGSTGKFYAQIVNGAPFDILLAADQATPERLERAGYTLAGSRFTYATGRVVLWSRQSGLVDDRGDVLRRGGFGKLAIADPRLAPYGAAAVQVMEQLGVRQALQAQTLQGDNISMAYQWVSSGNAALGFVALSQLVADGKMQQGSAWIIPTSLHAPLRQDAVALVHSRGNPAAKALLDYLKGGRARSIIASFGYTL